MKPTSSRIVRLTINPLLKWVIAWLLPFVASYFVKKLIPGSDKKGRKYIKNNGK